MASRRDLDPPTFSESVSPGKKHPGQKVMKITSRFSVVRRLTICFIFIPLYIDMAQCIIEKRYFLNSSCTLVTTARSCLRLQIEEVFSSKENNVRGTGNDVWKQNCKHFSEKELYFRCFFPLNDSKKLNLNVTSARCPKSLRIISIEGFWFGRFRVILLDSITQVSQVTYFVIYLFQWILLVNLLIS